MTTKQNNNSNPINSLISVKIYFLVSILGLITLAFDFYSNTIQKCKRDTNTKSCVVNIEEGRVKTSLLRFKTTNNEIYEFGSKFRLNCNIGDSVGITYEAKNPKNVEVYFDNMERSIFVFLQGIDLCLIIFLWSIHTYTKIKIIFISPWMILLGYVIFAIMILELCFYIIISLLKPIFMIGCMGDKSSLWLLF